MQVAIRNIVGDSFGKEKNRMRDAIFMGSGTLGLDLFPNLSVLREKAERYAHFPKMMNLFERFNGFFDSRYASYWEEETGLPWQEWGKL
jgi:hypothetical protein